jgi:hypothetical protein
MCAGRWTLARTQSRFPLECGLRSPPLRQAIRLASPHCDPNRSIFTANVRYALTPLLAQSRRTTAQGFETTAQSCRGRR